MVGLICGHNGTGKTKRMIEMANKDVESIQGKMVFLEAGSKHIFDLNFNIRYINTKEYDLTNDDQFHGFVCGLLATDYDIEKVYIDGLYKIAQAAREKLNTVIDKLNYLSEKFNVEFVISVNHDKEDIPQDLQCSILV